MCVRSISPQEVCLQIDVRFYEPKGAGLCILTFKGVATQWGRDGHILPRITEGLVFFADNVSCFAIFSEDFAVFLLVWLEV